MLDGALVTLQIAVLSMMIGVVLRSSSLAIARNANSPLPCFATTWIEVARNTPALFQIYMAYFGLGQLGIHVD